MLKSVKSEGLKLVKIENKKLFVFDTHELRHVKIMAIFTRKT